MDKTFNNDNLTTEKNIEMHHGIIAWISEIFILTASC